MPGLLNLFVNNKNKPTSSSQSYVVKREQEREQRNRQKRAWASVWGNNSSGSSGGNPVDQLLTNNAEQMWQHSEDGTLYGDSDGDGYADGGGGGGSSDGGGSLSPEEEAKEAEKKAQEQAQKRALASIKNMKDSNVPFHYRTDYSDLWNRATKEKQNDIWIMKEEVFLYTFHDKKRHRYLNSFSIDCDKSDILGTAQVTFPYHQDLMEYWIPGKTTFAIIGGTFDREVLFIGRVSEINQRGDQIDMVGQNVGWKFKAYATSKFESLLNGMSVKNAVKLIFKQIGLTKGRYHIDLRGIPNIDSYTLDENLSVVKDGATVENVPELIEVVQGLKASDIDKYIAKRSQTRDTQKVADDYDKNSEMVSMDKVREANHSYQPSSLRQNYGISTTINKKELLYTPILEKIQGKQKLEDYLVKGYSGDGENTYEDIIQNIASAIDAHFFVIDTTVCFMSYNALIAHSQIIQKNVVPEIDFWQLEEGTYELNINQFGYYNTVHVKYKNGTVTKRYDDLVRVFNEIPITYEEPNLDYEGAMLKAQAYLSAHIRDFGMELKATILHTGKIIPSTFIKLKNPLTMSEGLFFIQGVSVQWSADTQTLVSDLDLRFGPENPDNLEVPESGASYSGSSSGSSTQSGGTTSGDVSPDINKAAKEIIGNLTDNDSKALAIYNWVDQHVVYELYSESRYSSEEVLRNKRANCWDTAYLIYKLCTAVGVKCEVHNGMYHFLDQDWGHLWNMIYYKGKMTFADTGRNDRNPIGEHGAGRYIISDSLMEKNY